MEFSVRIEKLRGEIASLRDEWRRARGKRLLLKDALIAQGMTIGGIRKEREYRALKKEQRRLFILIRQRERRLSRIRAADSEKGQ